MNKNSKLRARIYEVLNKSLILTLDELKLKIWEFDNDNPISATRDGLVCPLCYEIFLKNDLDQDSPNPLTLEHIEPDSIGGTKCTLTCKRCNNNSGKTIDKAIKDHVDFKLDNTSRIRYDFNGILLKGGLKISDKKKLLLASIRLNNDYLKQNIHDFFNSRQKVEIKFRMEQPSIRKINCGLLKIAHLKMFNLYGYGYLFNPSTRKIVEQINNPDKQIIKGLGFIDFPDSLPKGKDVFLISISPAVKAFMIKVKLIGEKTNIEYGVFIPGPRVKDLGIYAKLGKNKLKLFDIDTINFKLDTVDLLKYDPYCYVKHFNLIKNKYN